MHPLETYLTEIAALGGATMETSGYPALSNLLNAVGHTLKPKVKCIIHPKNSGAGIPDGGLFTPDQLKNRDEEESFVGQKPARGAIEVKPVGDELNAIIKTQQVMDYLEHYGQTLLTNYREFLLLKRAPGGKTQKLENFQLAANEKEFWLATAHPRKTAADLGERLSEYLKRVMLHNAPLNNPKDVAFFLASYARDARVRVEAAKDLPALAAVRTALEEALGMKFEADKGEHFFRSTLVQTLFYGVFSAWVLWHKENPARKNDFDWKSAAWTLHVPMIKALFEQVATPTKLGPLELVEVLDWTAAALNRVDRAAFFEKFLETHAVQYFYEPFLEAFDPELRKQLGVWYTPPEIVQYQVARVDTALREELEIPDGLADPRVFVLDPCCGTGAYLVEVLRKIGATLKETKGEDALAMMEIKEAAQKRVFGFEILPAPFVVAHLQMGLLLQNLSVPLDDSKSERAGIFLTNALTGWDFAGENPKLANWPELEAERKGASKVKQEKPILVILGNPPYNAYAGISPEEEQGLVEVYKGVYEVDQIRGGKMAPKQGSAIKKVRRYRLSDPVSKGGWGIKKFNLDDLYVRFFRLAERRIAEKTGQGIVCFISNYSYLSDPSFVVMRERFLQEFDSLWVDCLNGDSRETGKHTPEGEPDPSVFSTEFNRAGIKLGTSIGLLVRRAKRLKQPRILFRQFWGARKRAELIDSLATKDLARQYEEVAQEKSIRHCFRVLKITDHYLRWPAVVEICGCAPISGLQEMRRGTLMAFAKVDLVNRMREYLNKDLDWDEVARKGVGPTKDGGRFKAKVMRTKILSLEEFSPTQIRRYALYPFDLRWAYHSNTRPFWNEPRPALAAQSWKGNAFFVTRMAAERPHEQLCVFATSAIPDYHLLRPNAVAIPFRLRPVPKNKPKRKDDGNGEFGSILQESSPGYETVGAKTIANLSPKARAYLTMLGVKNPDEDAETAGLLWMHALAVGYSPAYFAENADGILQDWPRIPLPACKADLLASAALGKHVAALLDTEALVAGVDSGKIRPELVKIAVVTRLSKDPLNLSLNAGWGHAGKGGVTMPGKGRLETRGYAADEAASPLLGQATHDVFLNDTTCWRNVPERVWDYTIGGYQVIKKWLSYREHKLLGRAVTPDEAREVPHMARRIAALIILQPELDENYQRVKASTFVWKA